jgi:hypothetical protein
MRQPWLSLSQNGFLGPRCPGKSPKVSVNGTESSRRRHVNTSVTKRIIFRKYLEYYTVGTHQSVDFSNAFLGFKLRVASR